MDLPAVRGQSTASAAEVAGMLVGSDQALPVTDPAPTATQQATCRAFNRALGRQLLHAKSNDAVGLASPLIGTGCYVGVIDVLSLLALSDRRAETADQLAEVVWQPLKARGEKLVRDGRPIDGDEENLAILRDRAEAFLARGLPLLRRLQVV